MHNIATYADDTNLYSKFNQVSDLWQQLELASELESDLESDLRDSVQVQQVAYWFQSWKNETSFVWLVY